MTRRTVAALVIATAIPLTACAIGERPSFDTSSPFSGEETGDPNIDAVLAKLDSQTEGPYTATYLVTVNLGGTVTEAVVAREPGRRSVTANGVRYLDEQGQRQTCRLDAATPCEAEWQAQYVSDTIINPDFAGDAAARRLRRDAAASIAPTVLEQSTVAGQPATCVTIAVPGGNVQYCVLDNGAVGRIVDSDVQIDLQSYLTTVDPALFSPT